MIIVSLLDSSLYFLVGGIEFLSQNRWKNNLIIVNIFFIFLVIQIKIDKLTKHKKIAT
jgi:hypothetical protein